MPVDFVNEREIRVIGLARSGNHALISWLLGQATGRTVFLNSVEGKCNPFETARPMDDGARYRTNIPGFDLDREAAGEFTRKDRLVFNHEDSFLAHAASAAFERHHDPWVGPSRERVDVLVLRDPFNLFASRLRAGGPLVKPATAMRIWKQHARQFAGDVDRLPNACVPVSYNAWVASRAYRARLADRLGLPFTDAGFHRIPACNGGSSFDGLAFDGRAHAMRVFDRWRHYARDPAFRRLFDADVLALSERIFGRMPGMDAFVARAPVPSTGGLTA